MGHEPLRAFFALEIPAGIRSVVLAEREEIRQNLPRARWTRPQGWHLTLKFLGNTDPQLLNDLANDLRPRLSGHGAVTVRLGGTGFFPSQSRPRVAWVGGAAEGVEGLVTAIEDSASSLGAARERRRWGLHLTQARLRGAWPPAAVERFLQWGQELEIESFICSEAILFSSDLRSDGAVYTAMERFSLQ